MISIIFKKFISGIHSFTIHHLATKSNFEHHAQMNSYLDCMYRILCVCHQLIPYPFLFKPKTLCSLLFFFKCEDFGGCVVRRFVHPHGTFHTISIQQKTKMVMTFSRFHYVTKMAVSVSYLIKSNSEKGGLLSFIMFHLIK